MRKNIFELLDNKINYLNEIDSIEIQINDNVINPLLDSFVSFPIGHSILPHLIILIN